MATDVIMPKVDMDQETGTVARWLKNEGDEVKQGETILEIETDKVAIEVEAPASGILATIRYGPGETVPIATVIATILAPGEEAPAQESGSAGPQERGGEEIRERGSAGPQERLAGQRHGNGVPVTPVARNLAQAAGLDIAAIAGTGPRGKVTRKDVEQQLAADGRGRGKVYATPAARRLAAEHGLALETVAGSGPGDRIQADDVLAAVAEGEARREARPQEAMPQETAAKIIPLQGKRRTMAERLTASYQAAPHINFTASIDMSQFNETRARMNARVEKQGGARISATALLVKIVTHTLLDHPWLNSSLQEPPDSDQAQIYLYRDVHMGVAVALDDGLIVPVVHDAASKGVAQIAAEVHDLARRAREGQLAPAEVRGGTFTISNLGPFGIEQFTAIINPPQAAILAVGATQPQAVPDEAGQVVVRPVMKITLGADHRLVDGAVAAHFMADLKAALEAPVLLLL